MTASTHARQRRHPATEAGLWLVWITARVTGLAALARSARRRRIADHCGYLVGTAVAWSGRHAYTAYLRGRALVHRAVLRAELAAAHILTGPAPELITVATGRLRHRAVWLLLMGGMCMNALYLATR